MFSILEENIYSVWITLLIFLNMYVYYFRKPEKRFFQAKAGDFILGETGKINVDSGQTFEVLQSVQLLNDG